MLPIPAKPTFRKCDKLISLSYTSRRSFKFYMPVPNRTREEIERQFATAPAFPPGGENRTSLTLDIRLVTLLYGGGAVAGYPDEITPFRPSSVRGHLRFWWRATRGAEYNTWQALREREGQIWGDTDRQSPVRIRVDCPDGMKPKRLALRQYEKDLYRRYALFPPFEEKRKDLDSNRLLEGGGFQLKVSVRASDSDLLDDIDAALWGWLNFGGLGARTRRGVGALYCPQYAGWDAGKIRGDGGKRDWPVLKGGTLVLGTEPLSWSNCWFQLLRLYRDFRQDRGLNGRGKTSWPEPQQIRDIQQGEQPGPEGFPRGALGLPIVFHFKDEPKDRDRTLNVELEHGRMASPVILRPFAISMDQALPMVLVLKSNSSPLFLHGGGDPVPVKRGDRDAIQELNARAKVRWDAEVIHL